MILSRGKAYNSHSKPHNSMTERVGLKEEAQILLPAIASRMGNIPYAE